MHLVLVNGLGGLSLPRNSVVRVTDYPEMTIALYCEHHNNWLFQKSKDIKQIQMAIQRMDLKVTAHNISQLPFLPQYHEMS